MNVSMIVSIEKWKCKMTESWMMIQNEYSKILARKCSVNSLLAPLKTAILSFIQLDLILIRQTSIKYWGVVLNLATDILEFLPEIIQED